MGRPSKYTPELADHICRRLAIGDSMRKVCSDPEMPDITTVFKWIREKPEFAQQYARAKDESAHAHSERILEVIDKVLNEEVNPNAARVALDALKWTAARMQPKRYGDRVDTHLSGDIQVTVDKVE